MGFSIKDLLEKGIKYCSSSLLGTGVDTLVLWVFSTWVFKTYSGKFIISPFISFECAVLVNFTIAYFFIWKDRITTRCRKSFIRHYLAYNLSSTGMFFVKMLLLLGTQRLFGFNAVLCNLIALCITGIFNFVINETLIFKQKSTAADK